MFNRFGSWKGNLMTNRLFLGLVLAATVAACSSGGGTSSGPDTTTAINAATAHSGGVVSVSPDLVILHGIPPAAATAGSHYSYTPTVTAASGPVSFSIVGMPVWASFDGGTGTLSGTPNEASVGLTAPITITAHGATGTGSVGPFAIRVHAAADQNPPPNSAPVIKGVPAEWVVSGQSYSFEPGASDAVGRPLVFSIVNRPSWANFSIATGKLTGTPTAAQAGIFPDITISVSDGIASVELAPFAIDVIAAVAEAPVLGGTPAISIVAGQTYRFQPTVTDPAGLTPIFSISNKPTWTTFDTATGALTGTPTAAEAAAYSDIVISANNGVASASLTPFIITVTAPAPPDAPTIGGTPASTGTVGQFYHFTPSASDPAGARLTFSIGGSPIWATFDPATGEISGTPNAAQAGTYAGIRISASNGTASVTLPPFGIVVAAAVAVAGPTIGGTPPTSVTAGSAYRFTPTSTDPSGGTLTFSIQNAPAWAAFSASTGALSGTPSAAEVGTYSNITIVVSDGVSVATLTPFAITVTSAGGTGNTLTSIAVTPARVTLAPGASQSLTLTGTYSNGTTAPITSGDTFVSSNPSVASVSDAGVVTVNAGASSGATATISATNTASGLTTSSANSASVTVKLPTTGVPTATSASAATATAQDNALCATVITPFYWEIGDQNGALASGSVGVDSTGAPVTATTNYSIASASKWLYSTYVTQLRGSAANLTANDVNFLHFTSGYTNMGSDTTSSQCPSTNDPDGINTCLAQPNTQSGADAPGQPYGTQIPANIGIFDYDSGHMEMHASLYTPLGPIVTKPLTAKDPLATSIWSTLGTGLPMGYSEPLMAGGVYGDADEYTTVLRAILRGTLAMKGALGIDAVCTRNGAKYTQNPVGICTAGSSPMPERWHYSIGHWVEDDPQFNNDGAFSSPGAYGFYPWIDATKTYYGVISRYGLPAADSGLQQGYASQQCGQLIRRAWMTGTEQTGTLPTT